MRVGIVGGGQLGRMLALAGIPLGMRFKFLEPSMSCPAALLGEVVGTPYDDPEGLVRFAQNLSVATYEFENVPTATVEFLQQSLGVHPGAKSLQVAQDRIQEKHFFRDCGLTVQAFHAIGSTADLPRALEAVGPAGVLKTRRLGYDGKGQRVLRAGDSLEAAWVALGKVPCIYEAFVEFEREVSIIGVRARVGGKPQVAFYELCQNEHVGGILHQTIVPTPEGDRLGAHELAPRVHNSGHWTIEGAQTSQFENHLRAIAGLPLGSTALRAPCVMTNIVGSMPTAASVLEQPNAHLHLYGKSPRPGRKLGHVTVVG
ncbi:MAG: 5-(carboxyamino)imidazole ribonucleotide synthase [Phycisphaerales bacterium]